MIHEAAAAFAAVGVAGLGTMYVKNLRRERLRRSTAFDHCRGVLQDEKLTLDASGYPVLTGGYEGGTVDLKLLADTIQLRKLPVLWLMVTIQRPLSVPGTLDIMMRASNAEHYSPHSDLEEAIRLPAGWHDQVAIRSDNAEKMRPLLEHLSASVINTDPESRDKELLITPRGARLVYRIDESDRGHYLMTRQPKFINQSVERATVAQLLARLSDICNRVERFYYA